MKEIRVKTLVLRNFKGMNFALDAAGGNIDVFGANATGKTTLADAFSWLLFDKDSLGRSDFEIKNLDALGEAEHGLEHSVEAAIEVNGGAMILRKIYHEIWSKKRGSPKTVFTGHTTEYYLNGVPVQKKDYVSTVAEIAGEESVFRLLTTPTAFPSLHWQKQRALLLEICGNVSDADVIASDPALAPLTEILGQRTLDDHKKVVTARRSEINKELDRIPVRIDEQKRMMPDVAGLSLSELDIKKMTLEDGISACQLRLQGIDNGAGIAELSKQIQDLNYEIGQLQNKYYLEGMRHVTEMNAKINELQSGKDAQERRIKGLKDDITSRQQRIHFLETSILTLREKFYEVDTEEFKNTIADTCPACGQALPTDRVMEAYDKALAHFNQDKAERILKIQTEGKGLAAELERVKAEPQELHAELMEIQAVGDDDQYAMLVAERDILKARAEDYSQIPGRAEMLEKKTALEKQVEEARAGLSQDKDLIQKEITDLNAQLAEVKEKIDRFTRKEQGTARIEELKAEEKKLTAEFERLEQELYLIEAFIKAKVSMLTERINGLFEFVKFKLYDMQINQGLSECCVATVSGVPYDAGLNSAARIQAGLDIARTLQRHYGLVCPIWIDNRESCTEIPAMDCQVLSLFVSPEDKILRVESARKRNAA